MLDAFRRWSGVFNECARQSVGSVPIGRRHRLEKASASGGSVQFERRRRLGKASASGGIVQPKRRQAAEPA